MKNILYILLSLSILSVGCSKEDDIFTNNLDSRLFGEWKLDDFNTFRSFSSNGKWGYWISDDGVPINESSGDWWVENDKVILQYHEAFNSYIMYYTITGNTLTLNYGIWTKQ